MATIKKAQKGTKLTVKRTREVADSLKDVGYKKLASSALSKLATQNQRDSLTKYGWKDVDNAERYKKLADDAGRKKSKSMKNGGKSPAWQRSEGKSASGGLNAKGRASYNAANPGKPGLKAPQPEGGSRKKSFCARMSGMKKKLTSSKTANDPNSRINKSLRKWKC
jgi:hypothetical protein